MQRRYFTKLLVVTLFASLVGGNIRAQSAETMKYPPAALKADFSLLRNTLREKYPSLYRYTSKPAMDALFDSCYEGIRDSMNVYQFYAVVARVVSAMKDGHAEFGLPKQALEYMAKHIRFFPMRLWFKEDTARVICGSHGFSSGVRILSIDDQSIGEITNRLYGYWPGDGAIQTGKVHALNDNDDIFSELYYLAYGPKAAFTVEYLDSTGERKKTLLEADGDKHIRCGVQGEKLHGLSLDAKEGGVAVLTVGRFDTKVDKFSAFLHASFAEINRKRCTALIIDLRNNGGGEDPNGAALYSYLSSQPFSYYSSLEAVEPQRRARYQKHNQLQRQQPAETPFLGKVFFLINGYSFSATTEFCAVARNNGRGLFIGEETGGGYYGNTSGDDTTLILPITRISVDIPLVRYTMAVRPAKYPDRGIIPDHTVLPSFADWIGHKDVQMEYALLLARAGDNK